MTEQDCIFCRVVAGDVRADIVFQDDRCVAFRDINPQAPVHVLIMPREHIESLDDAGRGEYYVSSFQDGREIVAPHLAQTIPPNALRIEDFLLHANVSVGCARRARQIVAAGEQDRYADVTPIYVRPPAATLTTGGWAR